jgi:hypothetical protein
MDQADSVHSTPPTNVSVCIASNQQKAVLRVGSLELDLTNPRKKADFSAGPFFVDC